MTTPEKEKRCSQSLQEEWLCPQPSCDHAIYAREMGPH